MAPRDEAGLRRRADRTPTPQATPREGGDDETEVGDPESSAVVLPITDVLDLHSFPPREIRDVVGEYLEAAHERGLRELRIIHGRGLGVQRRSVQALLSRHALVVSFRDAPPEAGGWGATLVELKRGGE